MLPPLGEITLCLCLTLLKEAGLCLLVLFCVFCVIILFLLTWPEPPCPLDQQDTFPRLQCGAA